MNDNSLNRCQTHDSHLRKGGAGYWWRIALTCVTCPKRLISSSSHKVQQKMRKVANRISHLICVSGLGRRNAIHHTKSSLLFFQGHCSNHFTACDNSLHSAHDLTPSSMPNRGHIGDPRMLRHGIIRMRHEITKRP